MHLRVYRENKIIMNKNREKYMCGVGDDILLMMEIEEEKKKEKKPKKVKKSEKKR